MYGASVMCVRPSYARSIGVGVCVVAGAVTEAGVICARAVAAVPLKASMRKPATADARPVKISNSIDSFSTRLYRHFVRAAIRKMQKRTSRSGDLFEGGLGGPGPEAAPNPLSIR
jgi:hypothetical protein